MSVTYRQSIIVELEAETNDALFEARLRFEKAMVEFGKDLSKLKLAGKLNAVMADKPREWNPATL